MIEWGGGVAGLVVVEWRGGDRMWWVGVAGLVVVEWRGVIECGLVLVEFLGGLVVIEMVGGCRIRGGD